MSYGVRFIDDEQLPEGHDFAMIRTPEDTLFFVKRSRVTPRVLEQAWAAFRALPGSPEPAEPSGSVPELDVRLEGAESFTASR